MRREAKRLFDFPGRPRESETSSNGHRPLGTESTPGANVSSVTALTSACPPSGPIRQMVGTRIITSRLEAGRAA